MAAIFGLVLLLFSGLNSIDKQTTPQTPPKRHSTEIKIKTSNCQTFDFDPVTPDPLYDFSITLGKCDKDYLKAIADADNAYYDKDYNLLKTSAQKAESLASTDFQKGVAKFMDARYSYELRDNETAEKILIEASKLSPQMANIHSLLSANSNNTKNYPQAESYGRVCVKVDNLFAFCHSNLGVSLLQQGKKEEGFKELEEAKKLAPKSADIAQTYKWGQEHFK